MHAFPWYIIRKNPISVEDFSGFRDIRWIKQIEKFKMEESRYEQEKQDTIKRLEQMFKRDKKNEIINVKRKVYNNKIINPDQYSESILIAAKDYLFRKQQLRDAEIKLTAFYDEKHMSDRKLMQRLISNNHELTNPLPLVNLNFFHKVNKFLEIDVKEHTANIRKVDYQLSRIISRAALKTSPFSSFTSIEIKKFNETHTNKRKTKAYHTEINFFLFQKILHILSMDKEYARNFRYKMSSFYEKNDHLIFIPQIDLNRGKVFNNVEKEFSVKNNIMFREIIQTFRTNETLSYEELTGILKHYMDNKTVESFITNGLLKKGLLFADVQTDEYSENVIEDFIRKLEKLPNNSGKTETIINIVQEVYQKTREYETQFIQNRFKIMRELKEIISKLENVLRYPIASEVIFYEDYIINGSNDSFNIEQNNLEEINILQKLALMINIPIQVQFEFAEVFNKEYSDREIPVNSLELKEIFMSVIKNFRNWSDLLAPISNLKSKKALEMEALKKEIKNHFLFQKSRKIKEINIDRQLIEDWYKTFKTIFTEKRTYSSTALIQKSGSYYVLNKLYAGSLRLFSRFFEYFPEIYEDPDFRDYTGRIFPKNTIEIREGYGFNANRHRKLIPNRLILPNSRGSDDDINKISIDNLYFKYNKQTELVEIFSGVNNKKVEIECLGSLVDYMLPNSVRMLLSSVVPRLDTDFINLWEHEGSEDSFVIDHIPSIRLGDIIISREKWLVNTAFFKRSLSAAKDAKNLSEFFIKHGLPMEFFAKKYLGEENYQHATAKKTDMKPQYFNLYSPIFIKDFKKFLESNRMIIIEEIKPIPQNRGFNKEYQIEVLLEDE
ncbi:lantibiotic dehydratase [Bacillus amyloliquefaciens]